MQTLEEWERRLAFRRVMKQGGLEFYAAENLIAAENS